jgi:hypothetical protein
LLLLLAMAWAEPADVPLDAMAERNLLDAGVEGLRGRPGVDLFSLATAVGDLDESVLGAGLALRYERHFGALSDAGDATSWRDFRWGVREWGSLSAGSLQPVNALGDELGLGALRGGLDFWARSSLFELRLRPELRLDVLCSEDGVCGEAPLSQALLALHVGGLDVRFGMEEREAGPGERGNLILGRDMRPWPAATVAYARDSKLGHWSAEWGLGWLPGERGDVEDPGLLHVDLRWSPSAWLELGLTRASMFGGEGRPWPTVLELLLPLKPHVSGDPGQILADTNEIAAVDGRVNIPLHRWGLGPLKRFSLWYQYGGEDMIMRSIGPLPVPSLAGPANLYGGELSVGDWSIRLERALLLDDTFRWYTGHRVYHEGFVRDGHVIGHPHGGDADSLWLSAAWYGLPLGAEVFHERLRRVGVVESTPEGVFRLSEEELSWRAGARLWLLPLWGGHLGVGYSLGRVEAEDFVPGKNQWLHRAWVELSRTGR